MMHRESGSYFHFLLRGWLISYYIVHQRPVTYASFREKRIRHPVLSRRAMYYSRNIRHFHWSAYPDW